VPAGQARADQGDGGRIDGVLRQVDEVERQVGGEGGHQLGLGHQMVVDQDPGEVGPLAFHLGHGQGQRGGVEEAAADQEGAQLLVLGLVTVPSEPGAAGAQEAVEAAVRQRGHRAGYVRTDESEFTTPAASSERCTDISTSIEKIPLGIGSWAGCL